MANYWDYRDILIQKRPKLIQSGHFKSGIDSLQKQDINRIGDVIAFDYMGSAEFEWRALPRSLRRMTINKDFYSVFVFSQYKDETGNPLKVYAPQVFFKNVKCIVERLVENGDGLQECCFLCDHIQKQEEQENDSHHDYKDTSNFWWDIENDFFMFFEHTDKVLMLMDVLRNKKFGYENGRNISKSVLRKKYVFALTRPTTNEYIRWDTSIKSYSYDEKENVHFIEFWENLSLEDALMESMIIAKVAKGIVRFDKNSVSFMIDENTATESIIMELGISLIDSRTYSDKIEELVALYNETIEKRQKQKELVRVLKLVRDKKLRQ